MVIHKKCVICEKPLHVTQGIFASQLCGSAACDCALSNHLNSKLACCSACGRPIHILRSQVSVASFCHRFECQSQSSLIRAPDAIFCRICSIHVANDPDENHADVCKSPFCQRRDSSNASRARAHECLADRAKRRQGLEEMVKERTRALRPSVNQDNSLSIVVLPFLKHNLESPSTDRLLRVEAGFLKLATLANALNQQTVSEPPKQSLTAESSEPTSSQSRSSASENRFARLNGAACGTCGGKCCNLGGDDAFLNSEKFREILLARPEAGPADIVSEYMARIPEETFQNSCIFHGLEGCGLAREQRAITCNTYLCTSLQDLRNSMDGSASGFLMAATNFRDVNDSELEVYRIKFVDDSSDSNILSEVNDRRME